MRLIVDKIPSDFMIVRHTLHTRSVMGEESDNGFREVGAAT